MRTLVRCVVTIGIRTTPLKTNVLLFVKIVVGFKRFLLLLFQMMKRGAFSNKVTSPVTLTLKGIKVWQASGPDEVPMFDGEVHQQLGFVMGGRSRPKNIHTLLENLDGEEEYWKFELGDAVPEMQAGDVLLLRVDVTVDPHECSWVAMTKNGAYFGEGIQGSYIDPEQAMLDQNSLEVHGNQKPLSNLRIILMYLLFTLQGWRDRWKRA